MKDNRISKHISYREGVHSHTAKVRGIPNKPGEAAIRNMSALAANVFEPLREWVGGGIKINSFYRSPKLNAAIGGSRTSQHTKGEAVDIDDVYGHKTNAEMFWWIVENTDFDQIIWEFGNSRNPDWVHVSYKRGGGNRGRLLKATRKFGRTHYELMKKRR